MKPGRLVTGSRERVAVHFLILALRRVAVHFSTLALRRALARGWHRHHHHHLHKTVVANFELAE